MAGDARKHQKRMERRNKRAKEKRREYIKGRDASPFKLLKLAGDAPFLPCRINEIAFTQGMGNLSVARQLPNGTIIVVAFLVDLYCLGIKDVTYRACSKSEFEVDFVNRIYGDGRPRILTPEEAKKLVEGAVSYAAKFGIRPHEDYEKAKAIFQGVDSSTCTAEYQFGKDGKPYYICGPNDGVAFQKRVLALLDRNAGPGNYHFMMSVGGSAFGMAGDGEEEFWEIDGEYEGDEMEDEDDDNAPIPVSYEVR